MVHTLTRLADTLGKPTPAGTKVGVTVAELAGKCGLETPQVDEIIQKIVKAKLLIVEPDGITISNAEKGTYLVKGLTRNMEVAVDGERQIVELETPTLSFTIN